MVSRARRDGDRADVSFSVVLPLYNKALSVGTTVASVLAQTHATFELVIVNDGSSDGSRDVVATIDDPRVRIVDQANGGVSVARNRGIEEARFDLVAFIDADDLWHPTYLEAIAGLVERYSDAECFSSDWAPWSRLRPVPVETADLSPDRVRRIDYVEESRADVAVHICSLVARRDALEAVGGFSAGVRVFEDQELCCRLSDRGRFVHLATPLVYYVRDSENRACERRELQPMPPYFEAARPMMLADHPPDTHEWYMKEFLISRFLGEASFASQIPGARGEAASWWWACRRTERHRPRFVKNALYLLLPSALVASAIRGLRGLRGAARVPART